MRLLLVFARSFGLLSEYRINSPKSFFHLWFFFSISELMELESVKQDQLNSYLPGVNKGTTTMRGYVNWGPWTPDCLNKSNNGSNIRIACSYFNGHIPQLSLLFWPEIVKYNFYCIIQMNVHISTLHSSGVKVHLYKFIGERKTCT